MKGKEPAICGFCLVEMAKITAEQRRKNAESKTSRKFTGG
jgi:hypothetical protein